MTNPSLCVPPSPELIVRTVQVDGWTRVAPLDKDLNEALLQYGNMSPTESSVPGWYDPMAILIGLNNVYMSSPSSQDLEVKLANARRCILKTLLKEICHDIFAFGRVRTYLDQVSPEAFHTTLFKVLLTMVQTLVRVRVNYQSQVAIDGCEYDCCLSHVDKEAQGWRIKLRRCKDNLESEVCVEWTDVERLPGFVFDDDNFYGHRPVSTWEWFSLSEVRQGRSQDMLPEYADNVTMEHGILNLKELLTCDGSEGEFVPSVMNEEATVPHDEIMAHGGLNLARDGSEEELVPSVMNDEEAIVLYDEIMAHGGLDLARDSSEEELC
jgi:hypothetical protein